MDTALQADFDVTVAGCCRLPDSAQIWRR